MFRRNNTIWDEMRRMQEEMDRLFNAFAGGQVGDTQTPLLGAPEGAGELAPQGMRRPVSDIWEDDNNYYAELEMPGVNKDDISVDVEDDRIQVKAEQKKEDKQEDKEKGMYRYERSYSGFYRALRLPENADKDNVDAEYKDGVLKITMPKKQVEESKQKKIEVK